MSRVKVNTVKQLRDVVVGMPTVKYYTWRVAIIMTRIPGLRMLGCQLIALTEDHVE